MFKEGRPPLARRSRAKAADRPPRLESRRSLVARSISAYNVVAASPDFLPVPINPMSRLPDVIPVARPISGTASVIRAVTDCHRNRSRISTIVRPAVIWSAIIRSTVIGPVARISRVIIGASTEAKRGGNDN